MLEKRKPERRDRTAAPRPAAGGRKRAFLGAIQKTGISLHREGVNKNRKVCLQGEPRSVAAENANNNSGRDGARPSRLSKAYGLMWDLFRGSVPARSKLLLETTNRPVSTIALETGYCTPAHLTNAFKTAFGLSPKEWRNKTR